jgi:hypothetical protein
MDKEKNLTLKIDAQVLLWARMRALRDGTSINRRIQRYLEEYAAIPPEQRRTRRSAPSDRRVANDAHGADADGADAHGADADGADADSRDDAAVDPAWPDVDPGEAGRAGVPADHAELWGADGYRVRSSGVRLTLSESRRRRRARR